MSAPSDREVVITPDVIFGHALCESGPRPLMMDVYRPAESSATPGPAVILAFGGAFHRGSRRDDTVVEHGQSNTAIAAYCRFLAAEGYVAFSVDYRLAQEGPDPGFTPVLGDMKVPLERVRVVRDILGLGPITSERMRDVQEAAIDDMATAFRFVAGAARRFKIDPARIVVGGFSAGGRNAITAAFGEEIDPAAVISMSSYVPDFVAGGFASRHRARFPVLSISGERDLGYIRAEMPVQQDRLRELGFPTAWRVVPGHGHFYPAGARTMDGHGRAGDGAVLDDILEFLDRAVKRSAGDEP